MMNRNAGLTETPAAEAESSLLGQWGAVPRALGRLQSAASEGDLKAAHEAMAAMQAAVASVKHRVLPC